MIGKDGVKPMSDIKNRIVKWDNKDGKFYEVYLDVTEEAKLIFGDIIADAKLNIDSIWKDEISEDRLEDVISYAKSEENGFNNFIKNGRPTIDFSSQELIITFVNGKTVLMDSSEWGSVRTWDKEMVFERLV